MRAFTIFPRTFRPVNGLSQAPQPAAPPIPPAKTALANSVNIDASNILHTGSLVVRKDGSAIGYLGGVISATVDRYFLWNPSDPNAQYVAILILEGPASGSIIYPGIGSIYAEWNIVSESADDQVIKETLMPLRLNPGTSPDGMPITDLEAMNRMIMAMNQASEAIIEHSKGNSSHAKELISTPQTGAFANIERSFTIIGILTSVGVLGRETGDWLVDKPLTLTQEYVALAADYVDGQITAVDLMTPDEKGEAAPDRAVNQFTDYLEEWSAEAVAKTLRAYSGAAGITQALGPFIATLKSSVMGKTESGAKLVAFVEKAQADVQSKLQKLEADYADAGLDIRSMRAEYEGESSPTVEVQGLGSFGVMAPGPGTIPKASGRATRPINPKNTKTPPIAGRPLAKAVPPKANVAARMKGNARTVKGATRPDKPKAKVNKDKSVKETAKAKGVTAKAIAAARPPSAPSRTASALDILKGQRHGKWDTVKVALIFETVGMGVSAIWWTLGKLLDWEAKDLAKREDAELRALAQRIAESTKQPYDTVYKSLVDAKNKERAELWAKLQKAAGAVAKGADKGGGTDPSSIPSPVARANDMKKEELEKFTAKVTEEEQRKRFMIGGGLAAGGLLLAFLAFRKKKTEPDEVRL